MLRWLHRLVFSLFLGGLQVIRRVLPVLSLLALPLVGGCGGGQTEQKDVAKPLYEDPTGVGMPKDYEKVMYPKGAQKTK